MPIVWRYEWEHRFRTLIPTLVLAYLSWFETEDMQAVLAVAY